MAPGSTAPTSTGGVRRSGGLGPPADGAGGRPVGAGVAHAESAERTRPPPRRQAMRSKPRILLTSAPGGRLRAVEGLREAEGGALPRPCREPRWRRAPVRIVGGRLAGRSVFWLPDPPIRRSFPATRPVVSL